MKFSREREREKTKAKTNLPDNIEFPQLITFYLILSHRFISSYLQQHNITPKLSSTNLKSILITQRGRLKRKEL